MEKAGDLPLTLLTSKPGPLPPRAAAANGSAVVRRGADFSALDGDSRHASAGQRPAQRQQMEQEDPFTREMRVGRSCPGSLIKIILHAMRFT